MQGEIYTDKALWDGIAGGDEESFRSFFLRHKDRVYSVAIRMTGSAYDAEETVQEVFVKLWTSRASLAGVEKPSQYLYAMVYNSLFSRFTRQAAERKVLRAVADLGDGVDHSLEMQLLRSDNRQLLERALARLTPQQRQVYTLTKLEGLSRAEVATRMQISPHTVKNHLQEAIKSLRIQLERGFPLLVAVLLHQGGR